MAAAPSVPPRVTAWVRILSLSMLAQVTPAWAAPGTLLASTPLDAAPTGARAWRIRYETTDARGARTESTGVVVAPTAAPAAPRDVVSWNHGTVGIVESCGPSLRADVLDGIPALSELLGQDRVVVATDYPGLGTRGPHGYLVGAAAAHAVLDGVRAAGSLAEAHAGRRFAVWGHSQGGHASLWAARFATSYAPELRLAAVAAISPPTDLPAIVDGMGATPRGILLAYVLRSWSRVYGVPLSTAVDRRTEGIIERATGGCVGRKSGLDQLVRVFALRRRMRDLGLAADARWGPLLRENSATAEVGGAPLLVGSAAEDPIVADAVTRAYVERVRATGTEVTFVPLAGGDHAGSAVASSAQTVAWLRERLQAR